MGVERLFKSFLAAMGASILVACDFCGLDGHISIPGQSAEVSLFLRLIVATSFVLIREPPAPIGQTVP
jgi:hypothetical protein